MLVELRVEARHDLVEGALFYEKQREGLGNYFTDCLFEDLDRLEGEAGIHVTVYGLHRKLSRKYVGHVSNVPGLTGFDLPPHEMPPSWHVENVSHALFRVGAGVLLGTFPPR